MFHFIRVFFIQRYDRINVLVNGETKLLIAHLADIHLGRRLYGLEWTFNALIDHFRQAFEKAIEERVDAIIIAGDLFDKPRPPNKALKPVIELVFKAIDKNIRVYSVLGEHDLPKVTDIPPQLLIPGLRVLGLKEPDIDCIVIDGVKYCIGGISHKPLKYKHGMKTLLLQMINSLASKLESKSVMVMHQNIVNYASFEPGLDINEIPEKPVYIAMGHLHRRIIHVRDNGQVIAYPGSLDILKRDEIRDWEENGKGFYIVDLSSDKPLIDKIDVDVIPQKCVETSIEDLDKNVALAAKKLAVYDKSILHVIVSLPPNMRTDVLPHVKKIVHKFSRNINIRLEKKYVENRMEGMSRVVEDVDEIEVIQEILGGKQYRGLAEKIYYLKQALINEDIKAIEEIIDEIAKHSYWDRKIRPPKITLSTSPTITGSRDTVLRENNVRGEERRGGRNLLSFF